MTDLVAADHREWLDAQPTVQRCAHCPGWIAEGTAAETREAFKRHLAASHPELVQLDGLSHKDRKIRAAKQRRHDRERADLEAKVERGRRRDAGYAPRPGTRAARTLAYLAGADGPRRFAEIVAAVDPDVASADGKVHAALTDLCQRGAIVKVARGVYTLPGSGRQAGTGRGPEAPHASPTRSEREPQPEPGRPAGAVRLGDTGASPSRSDVSLTRALIERERRFLDELEQTLLADLEREAVAA